MLRTAGRTLPQATSPSSTRMRAISAALSGDGSVVKTRSASVTRAVYPGATAAVKARSRPRAATPATNHLPSQVVGRAARDADPSPVHTAQVMNRAQAHPVVWVVAPAMGAI